MANFTLILISSDKDWQFHIATDIYWSRIGNFTLLHDIQWSRMEISALLLKSSGQEWQFHIATDI